MDDTITFPFPFKPYDVQDAFMRKLYSVLHNGEVGIFESPTGTGKSLSIICGSLKWLKDFQANRKHELQELLKDEPGDSNDDWFDSFLEKQKKTHEVQDAKVEFNLLTEHEDRIKKLKSSKGSKVTKWEKRDAKRKKISTNDENDEHHSDDDFIIDDDVESDEDNDAKEEKKHVLKIYYASRTHSQLAQFLGEIQRSPYRDEITVTTLASRASFCVNESVTKLKNVNLINDRCVDLQRKKGGNKCQFNKNFSEMQDHILSAVCDIEEIVHAGRELCSCPYYATRRVIPDVEMVLLPYNVLLHKAMREAYGIVLKDNILIIDEAHNLVEAVNSMYSVEINGHILQQTLWQLTSYLNCYKSRFSQENLRLIKLLTHVSKMFVSYLKDLPTNVPSKVISVSDFISSAGIGNVNVYELVKYSETSLIGQKLHGFTASRVAKGITPFDDQMKKDKVQETKTSGTSSFLSQIIKTQNPANQEKAPEVEIKDNTIQYKPSAIFNFIEFLKTLTFPKNNGRIVILKSTCMSQSSLKFLHLNPSSHFEDIVKDARSILLAGGTMQPISEFTEQLFLPAGVPLERISFFSCDHVMPPENLLAIGLETGPCGNKLDFTFKSRQLPETIKEFGSILLNVSNVVRGGVVCFFPSYDYAEFVISEMTKSKTMEPIKKKYKVFREPKLSSDVDRVLTNYARCVSFACGTTQTGGISGAILFSVVGGKMSEGINFSDDLGRCVIMVGLPYPNKFSVELQEKITYLNQQSGKSAGDMYYNNLCMKAVNQSIGRAIRHQNDYASILLLDCRYNNSVIKNLLPSWITKSFIFHQKFGPAYVALRKFFATKNNSS